LMLTRPLYHPVWLVAALGAVLMTVAPTARRPLVAAAVLPFLLVNVWYAKNYVQVGSYAASSWFGMHFRRGWVPTDEQTARITAAGAPVVWSRLPFLPAPYYEDLGYFGGTADPAHPEIDAPFKRNGEPNYNHRDYARLSRDMFVGDLHAIALYPGFFARRVAAALTIFLQPGPRPMPNKPDNPAIASLASVSNRLLLRGPSDRPNLFYLLFFAPLVFAGLRVVRGARDAPMRPLLAYMTVTMLWVATSIVLIEIGENDRMRFDVDPFVIVLLACTLTWLVRGQEPAGEQSRRRRTANRPLALE